MICHVQDSEVRIDPYEMRVRRQQRVEGIDPLFIGIAMRLQENFKHCNRRRDRRVSG